MIDVRVAQQATKSLKWIVHAKADTVGPFHGIFYARPAYLIKGKSETMVRFQYLEKSKAFRSSGGGGAQCRLDCAWAGRDRQSKKPPQLDTGLRLVAGCYL